MNNLIFFLVTALAVRVLGNLLQQFTPDREQPNRWLLKAGLFCIVFAAWFAASAWGIWTSIWLALLLGLITAVGFSARPAFWMVGLSDFILMLLMGFFATPALGPMQALQFAVLWVVLAGLVDLVSNWLLALIPFKFQTMGLIVGAVLAAVVVVFNPADLAAGSYRFIESRMLTVGLDNPFLRWQQPVVEIDTPFDSPYEKRPHSQSPRAAELIRSDLFDHNAKANLLDNGRFAPETGVVVHEPIDLIFEVNDYLGNPFDLVAKLTFAHPDTGETRQTELFFVGNKTWVGRFTATQPGEWVYRIDSLHAELNNLVGELTITPQPDLLGFVSYEADTWVRTGDPSTAFVPQFMMYKDPDRYYQNQALIDADVDLFINQHGFNGLHVNVYCRWFELETSRCGDIQSLSPNPDVRTFEALELLIKNVYEAGGVVHIWAWGDTARTQNPGRWGYNVTEDQRLQRYIAARLGPVPGWSMGYGFDLFEWTDEEQLDTWYGYMHQHMGWSHMLGARSYKNEIAQISERMDYAGYEQHRPDYATYVESLQARPDKPTFSEDRFRIDGQAVYKDYTLDDTRQGLWRSMMSGGVANIWGNLQLTNEGSYEKGSFAYPNMEEIKRYFDYSAMWYGKNMERCNDQSDQMCLKKNDDSRTLFYGESVEQMELDLSPMNGDSIPYFALNTATGEQETGTLSAGLHVWSAPSLGDWVIAVGEFETP